jgi:ABC-type polysaccharide/polyol phosphate transport system ATPase subunit
VIVAEGVSKRYPRTPVTIFPPVVSMFHRGWFTRRRSSTDAKASPAEGEATPGSDARPGRAGATTARPPARRRDYAYEDDLDDDEDELDDEDDDMDDEETVRAGGPTPDRPGEMFWALRDISFRVPPGAALGVLGGPQAGKSTLLRILGGGAFPTEGRVLVRDPVSPLPDSLARALNATGKGTHMFSLPMAANLLGVERRVIKPLKEEIEQLAQPVLGDDGDPLPGAMVRLAIATAIVLPTNAILLDEFKGMDGAFVERVVERLRQRLGRGSSLVLASRQPELIQELCDEVILLEAGSIVDRGDTKRVLGAGQAAFGAGSRTPGAGTGGAPRSRAQAPTRQVSQGLSLDVPPVVPGFNQLAALLSAELRTARGRAKRIDAAADDVEVEIRFETAVPNLEAHCGVGFVPRDGEGTGIRLEFSEPLRFIDPGMYVLVARPLQGTLRSGAYEVRADALISDPAGDRSTVIARDIGRVRIVGDGEELPEPAEPPITHWDGRELWLLESEWSIE